MSFDRQTDGELLQEILNITLGATTIHGRLAMRDQIKALLEVNRPNLNCGTPGCEGWTDPTESETET